MGVLDYQLDQIEKGNFWNGITLAFLCQFGYLLFIYELNWQAARGLGYLFFALIQFFYLFPLAVFYKRRNQELTANGVIIAGVISLLAAAVWFGCAAVHGMLPQIT